MSLIDITLQGVTALMLDRFGTDMIEEGPKASNGREKLAPKEQAANKLYRLPDDPDVLIWPSDNLLSCIIDAGRFIKIGKRQLSTRDTTTVTSFLTIVEPYLLIKSEHGWRVDARGIVNQATKGRHVCYRPLFDDWQLSLTIDADFNETSRGTLRELIDRAGKQIGIGVMRPARKGRYGMFKVLCWSEQKEKPHAIGRAA